MQCNPKSKRICKTPHPYPLSIVHCPSTSHHLSLQVTDSGVCVAALEAVGTDIPVTVASWAAAPVDTRSSLVESWCGCAALESGGRLIVVVGCSSWAVLAVASHWGDRLGVCLLGVADSDIGTTSLESSSADIVLLAIRTSIGHWLRIALGGARFRLGIADSSISTAPLEASSADIVVLAEWAGSFRVLGLRIADGGICAASLEPSSAYIVLLTIWASFCLHRWQDGWDPSRGLIANCGIGGATLESVRADIPVSKGSWTTAPVLAWSVLIVSGGGGTSLKAAGGLVVDVGSTCRAGWWGCACVDGSSDGDRDYGSASGEHGKNGGVVKHLERYFDCWV